MMSSSSSYLMLISVLIMCLPHPMLTRSSYYEAEFGVTYQGNISTGNVVNYHYNDTPEVPPAIRISVSSSAPPQYPVSFVVLQQKSVLSWSVPFQLASRTNYSSLSHTLCPKPNEDDALSIRVSTFSPTNLSYSVLAKKFTSFLLKTGDPVKTAAAPTEPLLLQYVFPEDTDTVMVTATSDDDICAYLSVQDRQCPVYDLFDNVQFKGTYQTMTRKSSITVQRTNHQNGFYVIVVIHPNNGLCNSRFEPLSHSTGTSSYFSDDDERCKNLTISVEKTTSEYKEPVLITICIGIAFYAFIGLIVFGYWLKNWCSGRKDIPAEDDHEDVSRMLIDNPSTTSHHGLGYGSVDSHVGASSNEHEGRSTTLRSVSLSSGVPPLPPVDSDDGQSIDVFDGFDTLEDIEHEQAVYLSKKQLFLSDTTRQEGHVRERKFKKYPWNLVTVAVFYALPVVQLVITYQIVVNLTGNQDTCYYNFLCSRPASVFSAFNNVFSNIGYIMLGILFWLLVWRREIIYKKSIEAENNKDGRTQATGIPKHYSLFYSLAMALIVEGIMSGCYHVCPNNTNFQFDTSFMYIIACLCMLKLYQQRHPDINPESYRAFFVFALIIFLGMLGVIFHNIYTYVIFFLLHIAICVYMSLHVYYKSAIKFDTGTIARVKLEFRSMRANKDFKPMHLGRFSILLFGNFCNVALSLYGLITQPLDFASFLLSIFIMNLLLYLGFYILMKLFHKERLTPLVLFFIVMTILLWAPALYFFEQGVTAWQETPASSRVHNRPCIVLDFYDSHDIWHFLSAGGLFFSFMTIFVLDDDLEDKPRNTIPVF